MAIFVKPIPVLKGKPAEKFLKRAAENEKKRASVDFSKQVELTRAILEKSNINKLK